VGKRTKLGTEVSHWLFDGWTFKREELKGNAILQPRPESEKTCTGETKLMSGNKKGELCRSHFWKSNRCKMNFRNRRGGEGAVSRLNSAAGKAREVPGPRFKKSAEGGMHREKKKQMSVEALFVALTWKACKAEMGVATPRGRGNL